jgi:hypothetical protein
VFILVHLYAQKRCAICDHDVAPLSSTKDVKNKDAEVAHLKTESSDIYKVFEKKEGVCELVLK